MKKYKTDLKAGDKFNALTVVEFSHIDKRSNKVYKCECECGEILYKSNTDLRRNKNVGCKKCTIKHHTKHSKLENTLLKRWADILNRCNNPKDNAYERYGARGIKVEWNSFDEFKNDMIENFEPNLQIDRIDNDGNYSKENCRWTTREVNASNRNVFKNSKSGYTGIVYHKRLSKYEASISFNGKRKYVGIFANIDDAIQARNAFIDKNNLPHKKAEREVA
jgi:hypothetical protein